MTSKQSNRLLITTLLLLATVLLASTAGAAASVLLSAGSTGSDVASVQRSLAATGFDPGPIDGVFGPLTTAAVRSFQQANSLVVDGIVGPQTIGALSANAQVATSRGVETTQPPPPQPQPLAGKTIVLDAGHGGPSGARGPAGSWEDDNVLAIARYARELLTQAGAEVVLTREGRDRPYDSTKPSAGQLEARVRIANRTGADVFVSIHNNASHNRNIRGMATYYRTADGSRTRNLAWHLQSALVAETGLRDIGLIPANFYVLRNTRMTSVLLEIGFISNPTEEALLRTDAFHRTAAMGIYRGLLNFYGISEQAVPTSTTSRSAVPRTVDKPIVYGYWAQWGNEPEPLQSLRANIGMMDMVSPYWYTALGDGSLRKRETGHDQVESIVRDHDKKMIVMINNDKTTYAMLTNDQARRRLADNIVNLVTGSGFDGVNIDFEDLRPHHRSQLTALVADLAARLQPLDKLTTVAVGAKWSTDESTNDWAAVYDYPGLARHADYLVIMAYDEHGTWRGPGPVASIDWVERIVRYAVAHVPPQQILLGIGTYGYDWTGGRVHSIVSADEALQLAGLMGVPVIWNDAAQVPMFRYNHQGRQHEVWFENSYSASRKLRLVNHYGLAGIALWKIGLEDQRFWDVLRMELLR